MTGFGEFETEKLRLSVLRSLAAAAGYELNLSTLSAALEECGFRFSHDRFLSEIAWLQEQGLVTHREILFVRFACLTQRGLDASKGTAFVPGVARP